MRQQNNLIGAILWGSAGLTLLALAWTRLPIICRDARCMSFMTAAKYFSDPEGRANAFLNPLLNITKAHPPVIGGRCEEMQYYFNKEFGRSDTRFSNYEGGVRQTMFGELYCDGGVAVQSLPTGKKTCSASIFYNPQTQGLRWYTENTIASCFVSQ